MRRGPEPLPAFEPPPGVSLRVFEEAWGPAAWERIVNTAFGRDFSFDGKMRAEPAFRPGRILFLAQEGSPVAVAAAWQRDRWPPGTGYLHYVAVLPGARGQGLGYWVSLAALHQMRREGSARALLETQDERLPAIKTYLKLGFAPDLDGHESYAARWEKILAQLTFSRKNTH
jgi:mycothiol synthase